MLFDYKSTIVHWLQLPITESRSAGSPPGTGGIEYVERFHDGQEVSPLDAKFEAFVKRTLYDYKVPGVAIAVINGNSTFARVGCHVRHLEENCLYVIGLWDGKIP